MHDQTDFRRRLQAAAQEWHARQADEARKESRRQARKVRIETRVASQLEHCVAALACLDAKSLLESVRDAALPGAFFTGDGCVISGPAKRRWPAARPPRRTSNGYRGAAARILTWGWPSPKGFVAIVVRGPVWGDDQRIDRDYRDYTLAWCTDRLSPPDDDDEREPQLRSWRDGWLDNPIGTARNPVSLKRSALRERLKRELVEAVRDGVIGL